MKRVLIASVMAASLVGTNLFAAEAQSPLAPGKPAGVSKAQDAATTAFYVVAVAGLGALLAISLSNSSTPNAQNTGTTTTTAT